MAAALDQCIGSMSVSRKFPRTKNVETVARKPRGKSVGPAAGFLAIVLPALSDFRPDNSRPRFRGCRMDESKRRGKAHSAETFIESRDLWWNADFLDLCRKRWNLAKVRTVLDVGCGVGHWGRTLAPLLRA